MFSKDNEIIKYMLDKNYDFKKNLFLNKPIHLICLHQDEEMIKYIINKGVSLNDENIDSFKPIDIICSKINKGNISEDILYFLVDKGAEYEHLDKKFKDMILSYYREKIKGY